MFERKPTFDAFHLPGPEDLETDKALALGFRWLMNQPTTPLIVLSAKNVLNNNSLLSAAVKQYRIAVVAPPRVGDAPRGDLSVLAPWASERALLAVDELAAVKSVCVIGWHRGHHDTWIAGHGARDLRFPDTAPPTPHLDPVVVVAMTHASRSINHNNALVQTEDKAYVVRTLQELVRAGYRFDVDELVAWAVADGWYPAEIPNLRDYAQKVLDGRTFRLRDTWGPNKGASTKWEAEAASGGTVS